MYLKLSFTPALVVLLLSAGVNAQHSGHEHAHHAQDSAQHSAQLQPVDQPAAQPEAQIAEKQQPRGPHGGRLERLGSHQWETVVEPGGIRLFAYNAEGQPLELRSARAVATLHLQGGSKRYRYDLFPNVGKNGSADSLSVAVDLRHLAGCEGELSIQLDGIKNIERHRAAFTTHFVGKRTAAQILAAKIAEQEICPVSGQKLGSMGEPIPVSIGDETVFVCCAGCIEAAKEKFKESAPPKIELTAAPATEENHAAIARQKVCPVMDEPLGSMGTPLRVTGLERDVYLCCKGCLKFLEKEPAKYLAKLPPLPEK